MIISDMKIFIRRWSLALVMFANGMTMQLKVRAQTPGTFLIMQDQESNLSRSVSEARPLEELILVGISDGVDDEIQIAPFLGDG